MGVRVPIADVDVWWCVCAHPFEALSLGPGSGLSLFTVAALLHVAQLAQGYEASRLELIAPALAVADIWPRPPRSGSFSTRAGNGRRDILLLSKALSLSERLLRNAERYVQGAMLCPGYYPSEDARGSNFVSRFREAYGTSPTAADAYGYDGLSILRGLVERGARTRAEALRLLASGRFEGLTGDIRFGPDHGRLDLPLVYFVDGDSIRLLKWPDAGGIEVKKKGRSLAGIALAEWTKR